MTIGESPILYMRVKKAKKVKMSGAQMNSYSSRKEMMSKAWQRISLQNSDELQSPVTCSVYLLL